MTTTLVAPGAYNQQAEMTVLGAILYEPKCLTTVLEKNVRPEDFFYVGNGDIFKAMCDLSERGAPVELGSVFEELRQNDLLQVTGGMEYLSSLVSAATTAEYVGHYAGILVDLASRRTLQMAGAEVAAMAPSSTADETAQHWQALVEEALSRGKAAKGRPILKEIVRAVFQQMEKTLKDPAGSGIPSGFVQLDSMMGGLRPSQLIVFGARPGVGKTALALNITLNVASAQHPVGFFSLEMAGDELVRRMLSMRSGLDHMRLLRASLHDDEWHRVIRAATEIAPLPIVIEDLPMTLPVLRQRVRFMCRDQGVRVIVLDYLQLVKNKSRDGAREREVAEVSCALKEMAKEHHVPIIALAQLNRGLENRQSRKPQLSDLRESGSIEQDADFCGFIHRDPAHEVEADRTKTEFIAAKNRHGPTGVIHLRFVPEITSFVEATDAPAF